MKKGYLLKCMYVQYVNILMTANKFLNKILNNFLKKNAEIDFDTLATLSMLETSSTGTCRPPVIQ